MAAVRVAAAGIAEGVEVQSGAIGAIASRLDEAARGNDEVLNRMRALAEAATAGGTAAQEVLAGSEDVGGRADALRGEVDGFLASLGRAGDRRTYDRHTIDLPCRLTWATGACEARLQDLSRSGASIAKALDLAPGTEIRIAMGGGPTLQARIARSAGGSTGLLFIASGTTEAELARLLARYETPEAAAA